jgi:hypothetical protein
MFQNQEASARFSIKLNLINNTLTKKFLLRNYKIKKFIFSIILGLNYVVDGYWRLTWSLILGPVKLMEVHPN